MTFRLWRCLWTVAPLALSKIWSVGLLKREIFPLQCKVCIAWFFSHLDDPVGIGWDFHALGPLLCAWCVQWVVLVSGQSRLLPSPSHDALSGTGGIPITQETWQLWSKFLSPVDPSLDTGIWRTSILQTSPINNLDLNSGQNSSMPQS